MSRSALTPTDNEYWETLASASVVLTFGHSDMASSFFPGATQPVVNGGTLQAANELFIYNDHRTAIQAGSDALASAKQQYDLVKGNKKRCNVLIQRCQNLVDAVSDQIKHEGLPDSTRDNIHVLANVCTSIRDIVTDLASQPFAWRLLNQDKTLEELEVAESKLLDAIAIFNVSVQVDSTRLQREIANSIAEAAATDQADLVTHLNSLSGTDHKILHALQENHLRTEELLVALTKHVQSIQGPISASAMPLEKFMSNAIGALQRLSKAPTVTVSAWQLTSLEVMFDRDDVNSQIGQGSFGTVFRGLYQGEVVAVKEMYTEDARSINRSVLRAVHKEIAIWSQLYHPRILQFYGACLESTRPFLVSRFCENGNIVEYLKGDPSKERLTLIHEISVGMAYLHKRSIIHADLKGANILIDRDGGALISDFGISQLKDQAGTTSTNNTGKEKTKGTLRWMAPEFFEEDDLDFPVDVYSFGITVWEVYTLEVPFGNIPERTFYRRVIDKQERPECPLTMDTGIIDLVKSCWAHEALKRPTFKSISSFILTLMKGKEDIKGINKRAEEGKYQTRTNTRLQEEEAVGEGEGEEDERGEGEGDWDGDEGGDGEEGEREDEDERGEGEGEGEEQKVRQKQMLRTQTTTADAKQKQNIPYSVVFPNSNSSAGSPSGAIETGIYQIINVRHANFAILPDANDGTPVSANLEQNVTQEMWKVNHKGGGRYTIQSVGFGMFAAVRNRASVGEAVEGKPNIFVWSIEETRVLHQFTIGTTDTGLIWSLDDNQIHTPVTLSGLNTDHRNWWIFKNIDDNKPLPVIPSPKFLIETGIYQIINAKQGNLATLTDGNEGTPLSANFEENVTKEQWKVNHKGGGRYTIHSVGSSMYAAIRNRASVEEAVEGKPNIFVWSIEETRVLHQFTIGTTDTGLVWSLDDNQIDTPVTLSNHNTDPRSWWIFKNIADNKPLSIIPPSFLIETGIYQIINAKQGNLATLMDGNEGTPLSANFEENITQEKWKVNHKGGGRYVIQSVGSGMFAAVRNRARAGTMVEGKPNIFVWNIETTRLVHHFTIGTTDTGVFWGLEDGQIHTPVALFSSAADRRSWWTFKKVEA